MTKASENVPDREDDDNEDEDRDSERTGRQMVMVLLDGGVPVIAELGGLGPWEVPLALGSRAVNADEGKPAAQVRWDAQKRRITASIVGGDLMSTGFEIRRVDIDDAGTLRGVAERARVLGIACDVVAAVWRREGDERWVRNVPLDQGDVLVNVIVSGSMDRLDSLGDELSPHLRAWLLDALKPRTVVPFRRSSAGAQP